MGDSIDILRGVGLAASFALMGGVTGAVVDGVVTGFTENVDGISYEHCDARGVGQLIFSLLAFGQVLEIAAPPNVDSPFAVSAGIALLFAAQPRMMIDLRQMFMKIERAVFVPRPPVPPPVQPTPSAVSKSTPPVPSTFAQQPDPRKLPMARSETAPQPPPQVRQPPASVPLDNPSRQPFRL